MNLSILDLLRSLLLEFIHKKIVFGSYLAMLRSDNYHYTLNGVTHSIPSNKVDIESSMLENLNQKRLMSVKFLLKYLHDLFEVHSIDYAIYGKTLLGYEVFQGVHIFQPTVEIVMMYRSMEEIVKEIQGDGFHIDFSSPYMMVISGSFFEREMLKAHIYFIHSSDSSENPYYHISLQYVDQCKTYREIPSDASTFTPSEAYKFHTLSFYHLFPYKKVPYEDFHLFIPNQYLAILNSLSLIQPKYTFSITTTTTTTTGTHRNKKKSANSTSRDRDDLRSIYSSASLQERAKIDDLRCNSVDPKDPNRVDDVDKEVDGEESPSFLGSIFQLPKFF